MKLLSFLRYSNFRKTIISMDSYFRIYRFACLLDCSLVPVCSYLYGALKVQMEQTLRNAKTTNFCLHLKGFHVTSFSQSVTSFHKYLNTGSFKYLKYMQNTLPYSGLCCLLNNVINLLFMFTFRVI